MKGKEGGLELFNYMIDNLNRVDAVKRRLRALTEETFPDWTIMLTSLDQAEHMQWLVKMMGCKRGIEVGTFVMLGYEGETMEDLEKTVRHLKQTRADICLTTVAYPIKGTEYYELVADRVVVPQRWETSTDRDLGIAGRASDRFYGFATRWMVNELAWDRGGGLRAWLNARLGRLGMWWLRRELEERECP